MLAQLLRRHAARLLVTSCTLGVLVGAGAAIKYFYYDLPHQRLASLDWLESASKDEVREMSHRVLMWPGASHHDACLFLKEVGDESSISILRAAVPHADDSDEAIGRLASCTLSHCQDALDTLEAKFGD